MQDGKCEKDPHGAGPRWAGDDGSEPPMVVKAPLSSRQGHVKASVFGEEVWVVAGGNTWRYALVERRDGEVVLPGAATDILPGVLTPRFSIQFGVDDNGMLTAKIVRDQIVEPRAPLPDRP